MWEGFKIYIGLKIKNLRQNLGITLEEVANKIGISRQTLSRYETGIIRNIPSNKIEQLSKVLNTTPSYLMGWEEDAQTDSKKDFVYNKKNLINQIKKEYGTSSLQILELYTQLDSDDQGEIRGEIKQMLKSDKYKIKEESKHA